jgi:hypothetical protein
LKNNEQKSKNKIQKYTKPEKKNVFPNFPLKNIVRFNVTRRSFVVDKKKTFTGQIG